MVDTNQEPITGSIYESAQECLEDNLPALSTETLIALHTSLQQMASIGWLSGFLMEQIETRKIVNAA
jgi:hypothetical protein